MEGLGSLWFESPDEEDYTCFAFWGWLYVCIHSNTVLIKPHIYIYAHILYRDVLYNLFKGITDCKP